MRENKQSLTATIGPIHRPSFNQIEEQQTACGCTVIFNRHGIHLIDKCDRCKKGNPMILGRFSVEQMGSRK